MTFVLGCRLPFPTKIDGMGVSEPNFQNQKGMEVIKYQPSQNLILYCWIELLLRFIVNFTDGNQFKYLEKLVSENNISININIKNKSTLFAALLSRARIEDHSNWSGGYWQCKCTLFISSLSSLFCHFSSTIFQLKIKEMFWMVCYQIRKDIFSCCQKYFMKCERGRAIQVLQRTLNLLQKRWYFEWKFVHFKLK